ncbi:Aspyridones efflux protein apdF [Pseudocercospora fuligena]|uniref:Aspyridones efflux protein apdF n=1 Tax=Pseudocercospora fuligena TaxID=685502 RepID=A0A8H6RHK5_9PEZI|nr:Aspyridones efflux protein apdF [Pseudocercospora fuligena]
MSDASELETGRTSIVGGCAKEGQSSLTEFDSKSAEKCTGIQDTSDHSVANGTAASPGQIDGAPPDGGLTAWTQVLCAHLTLFNTFGYISAFGVFQSHYQNMLGARPSTISWIGSLQIFLLFAGGVFTGAATDRGHFRPIYISGSILQIVGIFCQAESTSYWQLLTSQGVAMGLSNALQFCPVMSLVTTYFSKKGSLSLGIVALGACTGGVVFPLMVQQLLPSVGFKWTIRAIGFIMAVFNVISIVLLRPRLAPRKDTIRLVDWAALREAPFLLYAAAMFLIFWSLYFAFFYISVYGRGLGMSYQQSITLLITIICPGFIFRLAPAYVADKVGPLNTLIPMAAICSVAMLAWIGVDSIAGMYGFAAVYGSSSATIQAIWIAPIGALNRTPDLKKAGVRIGMISTIVAFASLSGPPLAGALIRAMDGSFLGAQLWGGLSFALGVRMLQQRFWWQPEWP